MITSHLLPQEWLANNQLQPPPTSLIGATNTADQPQSGE